MDLSEALRAYQAAADYYGQTQLDIAAASEQFQQATAAQQTAYSVLETAKQELLKAAREVKLPAKPPVDVEAERIRQDIAANSTRRRIADNPQA